MFMIMLCVVLLLIGQFAIIRFFKKDKYSDFGECIMFSVFHWFIGIFVAFFLCCALIPATGGLLRGYSEGVREGYVTKISEKGIIWKTYEAQIQVGTGEMTALQSPFEFSVPKGNKALYQDIQKNLGKKVVIEYVGWLIAPYWIGSSNIELTNIKGK